MQPVPGRFNYEHALVFRRFSMNFQGSSKSFHMESAVMAIGFLNVFATVVVFSSFASEFVIPL